MDDSIKTQRLTGSVPNSHKPLINKDPMRANNESTSCHLRPVVCSNRPSKKVHLITKNASFFVIAVGVVGLAVPSAQSAILVSAGNTILDYSTSGTLNSTLVTLPAGYTASGMAAAGGKLYVAANSATTGLIYQFDPDTSNLTQFASPGLGGNLRQMGFGADGNLYFASQGNGIYRTSGGGASQIQSNVQNTVGLTGGNFVIWGYAGPQNAGSLDGYGDTATSPGPPFNLVGPTGGMPGIGGTGNYYVPTAIVLGSSGYIAGVYAGNGVTFIKSGINYAIGGTTLATFGSAGDSNDTVNGLTIDTDGNLYASVVTAGASAKLYSFSGQSGTPTEIATIAGAGNILYFNTVPEPSTFVLCALGGLALIVRRRL